MLIKDLSQMSSLDNYDDIAINIVIEFPSSKIETLFTKNDSLLIAVRKYYSDRDTLLKRISKQLNLKLENIPIIIVDKMNAKVCIECSKLIEEHFNQTTPNYDALLSSDNPVISSLILWQAVSINNLKRIKLILNHKSFSIDLNTLVDLKTSVNFKVLCDSNEIVRLIANEIDAAISRLTKRCKIIYIIENQKKIALSVMNIPYTPKTVEEININVNEYGNKLDELKLAFEKSEERWNNHFSPEQRFN
jgi:hypothetical protein